MKITAAEIEKAVQDQCKGFYPMSLVGDAAEAVVRAVNQGIDVYLEACNVEGVDSYDWNMRKTKSGKPIVNALDARVSGKSLAVLLRRLNEMEYDEDDEALTLASDILGTLGFKVETCCFEIVSRTDMEAGEPTMEEAIDERP